MESAPRIVIAGGDYLDAPAACGQQRNLHRGESTVTGIDSQPNMTYQPELVQ